MSLTNTYENNALNTLIRGSAWSNVPTHIALLTADPTDTGSLASEVSGGSYARYAIGTAATFWSAASGGSTSNAATVEFVTATGTWGTVTHFALCDASSGGNVIAKGALGTGKLIESGDIARFAAGALVVTAD
jgi:hypothetical protein